ncbi:TetR/AcrR family transcriptional regulator [Nocardiopsis aegyptia]|uniref:AcrR family transcriptional regulator n=1 Tax=Nocardiopsis aegyptia TaxID=220378 RepID=A0A7Z0J9Z4_9ACTN|nr:TetR/AcrR family transcriptional regulator [Nocardiopsis aegyptia]NYJ34758.1 AcrR family transcriptional regulator [Nocardiopsis aegyptia]
MTRADRGQPVDRRVRRTQAALQDALTEIIKDQDLSRVSVADVVKQAGVSRSTFYDHYRDVHELSEAACTAVIDSVVDAIPKPDRGNATTRLRLFFANLAEHAGLFRAVLGPQGSARVIDHLRRRTTDACHAAMVDVLRGHGSAPDPGPGLDPGPGTTPGPAPATGPTSGSSAGPAPDPDTCHGSGRADAPYDVAAAFIAGALISTATDWLQNDCPRTPDEMAALTWPLLTALYPDVRSMTAERVPGQV